MKGRNTHQRYVASTHQRNPLHRQRKTSTPPPISRGVVLLFFAGADADAYAGGAGEYAGAGGGSARTDLRGAAMVAPGSLLIASYISTICSPRETTSPGLSTTGPAR